MLRWLWPTWDWPATAGHTHRRRCWRQTRRCRRSLGGEAISVTGRHHDDLVLLQAHPLAAGLGPAAWVRDWAASSTVTSRNRLTMPCSRATNWLKFWAFTSSHPWLRWRSAVDPLPVGDVGKRPGDPPQIRERVVGRHGDERGANAAAAPGSALPVATAGGERRLQPPCTSPWRAARRCRALLHRQHPRARSRLAPCSSSSRLTSAPPR